MEAEKKKIVIDRQTWNRKRADGSWTKSTPAHLAENKNALLNEVGGMCCLGFYCEQVHGTPRHKLLNVPYPSTIGILDLLYQDENRPHGVRELGLANINDRFQNDTSVDDRAQEQQIATAFLELGVEVEFIN